MALSGVFRLSFFVTLGLACTALALAEVFFLWWMGYFLLGTILFIGLAWRWEGRWVLSDDAANRLGMVIAIGSAFWILLNLPRNEEELIAGGVPWPAGLLPHLGPLLILLLLVKLFRPKRLTDFWVLQTIGLMMVTLACVLAADPLFGLMLVVYVASLLWTLALFYLVRETAQCRHEDAGSLQLFSALGTEPAPALPWPRLGLGRVTAWTGLVVAVGLLVFLIAPRQNNFQWEPKNLTSAARGTMRTGIDAGMDLNRIGKVELSEEPAFEVRALTAHGPKLDLSPDIRWLVHTLDYYSQGRWTNWGQGLAPTQLTWGISPKPEPLALPSVEGRGHPRNPPTDLKDPDFYLFFSVRMASVGGLVAAEPRTSPRLGLFPHLNDNPVEGSFFFNMIGTDALLSSPHGRRRTYQYGQVLQSTKDPYRVPAKDINDRYVQFLTAIGPESDLPETIGRWVRELLDKLPGLSEAERELDARGLVPEANHAAVAMALTRYLAFSGDFGYSLDLRRHDRSLDPMADFLFNVKEGHCERYASGLALMLRSVGIPARIIKGYRGAHPLNEGFYLVRQSQAHSWVQALVKEKEDRDWLTLDPTPATERIHKSAQSWWGWLLENWMDSDQLWRSYIMEYNADQQGKALDALRQQLPTSNASYYLWITVGLAMGGMLVIFLRRQGRARRSLPSPDAALKGLGHVGAGFYLRFLKIIQRYLHLRYTASQTPQELGRLVEDRLAGQALDPECAAIPSALVTFLYRAQYGGQPLTAEDQEIIDRKLIVLESGLRGIGLQSQ